VVVLEVKKTFQNNGGLCRSKKHKKITVVVVDVKNILKTMVVVIYVKNILKQWW
jgi:hypothetical protein